jgi:heterotetrameric sarcosine oxidase gamma subunit
MPTSTPRGRVSVAEVPVARSPIAPAAPVKVEHGWEISARRTSASLRIMDCTPLTKVLVRASANGAVADMLAIPFGSAARDEHNTLVVGSGPGEWLLLAPPGAAEAVIRRVGEVPDENLVSVFDATHGRALMRITGARVADLLAKVCGVDLSEEVTPDGAAFRSSVAKLVTDVVRDDQDGVLSYLLHCERSSGQYLFDALIDAGDEFDIEVEGFVAPEMRGVSR